jgi:hypothetical protein
VALAVLRCAADDLGFSIGQFAKSAQELFSVCTNRAWVGGSGAYVLIQPDNHVENSGTERNNVRLMISVAGEDTTRLPWVSERACVVVPLDPIVDSLRRFLFGEAPEIMQRQLSLPLPLVAVKGESPRSTRPHRNRFPG